jgi:hypothetical protein
LKSDPVRVVHVSLKSDPVRVVHVSLKCDPYRVGNLCFHDTEGVALGYYISPLRGENPPFETLR